VGDRKCLAITKKVVTYFPPKVVLYTFIDQRGTSEDPLNRACRRVEPDFSMIGNLIHAAAPQ
jgi:hypothetical protein